MSRSSYRTKTMNLLMMLFVLLIAMYLGYPHRKLDMDGTILPMLRKFANSHRGGTAGSNSYHDDDSSTILSGVNIVVTGGTSGIGLAITKFVLPFGATVIALGRSVQNLKTLQQQYSKTLHVYYVDQSNLISVGNVADQILQLNIPIHILVNNAGIHNGYTMKNYNATYYSSKTPNTYLDEVFVVNYLSHFLLTEKLLNSTSSDRATSISIPTRIVQISSSFHWSVDGSALIPNVTIKHDNNDSNDVLVPLASIPGYYSSHSFFRGQESYANSKLAQIYHTRILQQKLQHKLSSSSISSSDDDHKNELQQQQHRVISVCPSWVGTDIGRAAKVGTWVMKALGFPVNGWGIASTIHAMFDIDFMNVTKNTNGSSDPSISSSSSVLLLSQDYIVNSNFPCFPFLLASCGTNQFLRTVYSYVGALPFLWVQKFITEIRFESSSPESYNITTATSFYDWSYKVITKYL